LIIRESRDEDFKGLLEVEKQAFGDGEGPEIVELVKVLFADPTAKPLLSLVALDKQRVNGHIMFTKACIDSNDEISAAILAPLAVVPHAQNRGVGGRLIKEGLRILTERGVGLVFVLGHPDYYPRHGFNAAGDFGFEAPYPLPEEVAGAWMVQELVPGLISRVSGQILCANALDHPDYSR